MKELKIGEKVTITLEAVEQSSCDGCYFDDGYTCHRSTFMGIWKVSCVYQKTVLTVKM